MLNELSLKQSSEDVKTLLVVIEQLIEGLAKEFESLGMANQVISNELTEQAERLVSMKATFLALVDKSDATAPTFEQQLRLIETPLVVLIEEFEHIEQELMQLQANFAECNCKFNHLHNQVYGLEINESFENEYSLSEVILDLKQQLVAMMEEKDQRQAKLSNHVAILQGAFSVAQEELSQLTIQIKCSKQEPVQPIAQVNVNEELTLALANSLQQNRLLEHKLIKAQAQIDILKELMSGSFSLK